MKANSSADRLDSQQLGVPQLRELLTEGELALDNLRRLLDRLEDLETRKLACSRLHELARSLDQGLSNTLFLQSMPVPGGDGPIRLILHSAVFSPELWGKTFAEGLLKEPDIFDGKTIAELGTGSGWISLMLLKRSRVTKIVGLDINPIAILLARVNTWLNGTTADGEYCLSQSGEPLHKAFEVGVSDLLAVPIAQEAMFDHIIGCIPQVLHPDRQAAISGREVSQRDLYDLSNYCFEQGILEDRFGLPLIATALEQAQLCLKPRGRIILILGGRPGTEAIDSMFRRRGYLPTLKWSRRIPQADDTDLASLVKIEQDYAIRFHFFVSMTSELPVSASTAVAVLAKGRPIFHDLLVYQAETKHEKPTFGFVGNLHSLGLDSLRAELDFSRISEEQVSFLHALSSEILKSRTIRYPHERGDLSLRQRLALFLRVFCQLAVDPGQLFVGPERSQLVAIILSMVTQSGQKALLSQSLESVYRTVLKDHGLEVVLANDDLAEILELDDLLAPELLLIAPHQLSNPSPILIDAIAAHARKHPERWYLIDDSAHFDIDSSLSANILLRLAANGALPSNVVLVHGLVKNTVSADLELSFCLNAPPGWVEGLEVGAELTYSRIAYPTQLYYQWLFDDLLSFQFERSLPAASDKHVQIQNFSPDFEAICRDPVFAAKPIDPDLPGTIRLDYGEMEAPVPDLLVRGLFKGFLDTPSPGLPELVKERVCAYVQATRGKEVSSERVVLAQGVFPLFGNIVRYFNGRLGRSTLIAVPDGSYGPSYPMIAYHGGTVVPVVTASQQGFLLSAQDIENIEPKPDLLWLQQPSNPGGLFYTASNVVSILKACARREIFVLSDEIFFLLSDLALGDWTPQDLSFASHLGCPESEWLIVTDGLAKSFAAGGLRCGFMICPSEEMARQMSAVTLLPPRSTLRAWDALYSAFLEEAPHQLMDISRERAGVKQYLTAVRTNLDCRRRQLLELFKRYALDDGLDTKYRGGLFLLAKIADPYELARQARVLVNPPQWGRTPGWSRVCYSLAPQRFAEALLRLESYLGGC